MIPETDLEEGQLRLLGVNPLDTHIRLIVTGADVMHDFHPAREQASLSIDGLMKLSMIDSLFNLQSLPVTRIQINGGKQKFQRGWTRFLLQY